MVQDILPVFSEHATSGEKFIFIVLVLIVGIPMITAFAGGAPFVPTPQLVVDRMLKEAKLKKGERVVDPGCGDGRIVIGAAKKYGAHAVGYELFMLVYVVAVIKNILHGAPARFYFRDGRKADYEHTDVVMCYLLDSTMRKTWKQIWSKRLPKGARVVAYAFPIEGWTPVREISIKSEKNYGLIRIYEIGKSNKALRTK